MNINYNTFTQQQVQYITCIVEDNLILRVDNAGNKETIGILKDAYNQLLDAHDNYYNRLVELGDIVPPKTQEEINAELMEQLKESQKAQKEMLEIIKDLKKENGKDERKPNNKSSGSTNNSVPKPTDK